ncbi:MerR family transcriptional regulator [Streptomyces sp. TX20-6-3]|uniref:MerR family transcriptional regulator n=1 Tax=Streptomyces sp. TX20-6-3 TaxID=3028705 RepID=UPI0029BA57DA|nr:MerR family transcriptional regulator [Streptomyces sp. TX20-6-3]MDX2561130.1 MerR family transcriptional regulator [Streptomyces sp. TX20-6-3]
MADTSLGITTGALAQRLGVSPTTVRSWEHRYGIGPAVRADGKHRRWSPSDVAMLEEMCRLTASGIPPAEAARAAQSVRRDAAAGMVEEIAPPASSDSDPSPGPERAGGGGLPLGDVRQECRGLARAAVRLDAAAMETLLAQVISDYGLVTAWEEVMVPTLHAVGRKWESSDDRYVEVEHLLSWQVSTALRRAAVASVGKQRAPVLLACVPSEPHTLPLEALAAGLSERRIATLMFGGAVPAEALDAAVRRCGPPAVVLWSQARSTASHALARHVAGMTFGLRGARTAPLVLLAGPGWAGRTPDSCMLRPRGLREALDSLSRIYGDPLPDWERRSGTED